MIWATFGGLFLLLALSVPVAAAMGLVGLYLSDTYAFMPVWRGIGQMAWNAGNDGVLVAVPFFILLGELLLRSGMAARMYGAMAKWLSWLPGGLMHANIGTCAMFAATCGSSVATAATVGTTAIGEIRRFGYNERLFLGTIASSGTLGILIPPSINLIIYGALTNTSIPKLYLAGFIPGFLLAFLFSLTVLVACALRPAWAGRRMSVPWKERLASLSDLLPPLTIFVLVVGSIYAGWATPTEAAALGVLGALGLAALNRTLTVPMLREVVEGTMRTTGMTMLILVGAYFLNFVMGNVGLTRRVGTFMNDLALGPTLTILVIVGFYILLGCFMETLSMMVATVPIFTPVAVSLGYDPVWFGILVILLVETAMITPPVGINLFVVHGLRGEGSLNDVILGSLPFVLTLMVMVGLVIAFPGIVLFLPNAMG
jgi:tripartite ATP-independent transporter DctM subunit